MGELDVIDEAGGPGPAEPVAGTRTGLVREVDVLPDGRRITYYRLPAASGTCPHPASELATDSPVGP